MSKKGLSVLLSLVMALSLAVSAYGAPLAQDLSPRAALFDLSDLTPGEIAFINSLDQDLMMQEIKYLSEEFGNAVASSATELARAEYLWRFFETLGYAPWDFAVDDGYYQRVDGRHASESFTTRITGTIVINGHSYPANAPMWNAEGRYQGYLNTPEVSGPTVYFPTIAEAVAADPEQVAGKIVLTHRNDETYAPDVLALQAKGAAAVVYFYNKPTVSEAGQTSNERAFAAVTEGEYINIPVILVSYFYSVDILASIKDGDTVSSVDATVYNSFNPVTQNIFAFKPAAEPTDKFVMIGGHYDTVVGSPGANDNTSGAAATLAFAKALQNIPTMVNVVFVLWGGEEYGTHTGSEFFWREEMLDSPEGRIKPWFKENGIVYFNMDMTACSQRSFNRVSLMNTDGYYDPATDTWLAFPQTSTTPGYHTLGTSNLATDLIEKSSYRYWNYTEGKDSDYWDVTHIRPLFRTPGSDQRFVGGDRDPSNGIPSLSISWRAMDNDNTELNYHRTGEVFNWNDPKYDLPAFSLEGVPYEGGVDPVKNRIMTSIVALALYEAAQVSMPVE